MNSATKSLHLSVLLGSCFLLACCDLHAEDRTAGPSFPKLIKSSDIAGPKVMDARRLASNAVIDTNVSEAVLTPHATGPSVVEAVSHMSAPHPIPRGGHPLEGACVNTPRAGNGFMNNGIIVSDQMVFDSLVADEVNPPYQHPAPEVVLRFSRGCTGADFSHWILSSRDVPRSRPAIPHGPLVIDLRIDVGPVDFVELIFDGKPLKPTGYATFSPLRYKLSCPAVGQHVLQARYLVGNIWSYYSNALRFEVRLPNQPRIIAVSDFDRDPTPLTRHELSSITTASMKVHLANVDRGNSIVAYVDGKPVSSHLAGESCCRIIDVAGSVTPGVHKLTVRTVGCPGSCSITSQSSNEIEFHYYEEDAYLLRPGAGCSNKLSDKPCPPTLNSAHRPSVSQDTLTDRVPGQNVQGASAFRFVSYLQATPAVNAKQSAYEAEQFSQQAHRSYVAAHTHAAAAATQASTAANFALAAQQEADAAAADVRRAKAVASEAANIHRLVSKMLQRAESAAAIDAAKLAAEEAGDATLIAEHAHKQAEVYAHLAVKHSQVARRYAFAATKPRDQAKTARDQAAKYATDAQAQATSAKNLEANNLVVEAKRAEQQAAVERSRAEAAFQQAKSMATEAEKFERLATDFKDQSNRALTDARSELAKSKKALDKVVAARSRAQTFHNRAVAGNAAANGKDAANAYTETKKILDATSVAVVAAAQGDVKRSQESVDDAKAAVDDAESHSRRAQGLLKDAALALKHAQDSALKATRESTRADAYADAEAKRGDEAG